MSVVIEQPLCSPKMEFPAISWTVLSIIVFSFLNYSQSIENYRITYPKRMASYIDNSVNPCDDFFQYACGNYIKALRKGKSDFVLTAENQMEDFMHDILMEPLNSAEEDFSAENKAKMFYQSCIEVDHFKYPKSDAFLRLLDSIGGWPAVDPKWNSNNFDWFKFELLAAKYDASIFIFEYFEDNHSKLVLTAGYFYIENPVNFLKPYSREFQLAKGISMQIMKMYGVPKSAAKRIWKEIVKFGKSWLNFEARYQPKENNENIESIESLMNIIPNVDWEEYIKVKFGNYTTLNPDWINIFGIHRLKYFKKFLKGNERAAANYAAITLLHQLHTELHAERYNRQFCYNQLTTYLGPIEGTLYLARNPEEERIEEEIRTIFEYVKNSYRDNIRSVKWLSREVKQRLITKVNKVYLKLPEELHPIDFEALNEEYNNLEIYAQNDYYENFLAVREFHQQRIHLKFLHNENVEDDSSTTFVNAYYQIDSNTIVFEAGGIHKPYFFPDFPSTYNFGGIATALAHELGHAFDPSCRFYDELGKEFTWDNFSEDGYSKRETCFLNHYNAIPPLELYEPHNASISLDENIATSLAIRQAYFAYQKWLTMFRNSLDMTKLILPGLNMTSDQLFFLTFGQKFCSKLTRNEVMQAQDEQHGPNRIALIGSVSNFDQFSMAFNCDLGTPMNPKEKCTLF